MADYTLINNKKLNMNIYIKEDKISKHIIIKGEDKTKKQKLYLEDTPIAFQRAIICRKTICYRAKK
jgi:hypothetical protein